MLERLSDIDWNELGAPEIPQLLHQLVSDDSQTKGHVISILEDKLAPIMLLNGYGDYRDLIKIMQTDLPHVVTPFLIQILDGANDNRVKEVILGNIAP